MVADMRARRGYTILEVLVAVTILSLVLPAISSMVITSRKAQVGTLRFENAASYGQEVLDSMHRLPAIRLKPTGTSSKTINGQNYTSTWVATTDAQGGHPIALTVGWKVGGLAHSVTFRGALE
jgi:prepilin-type N-terminal cleavage/methylation domain-containing protein